MFKLWVVSFVDIVVLFLNLRTYALQTHTHTQIFFVLAESYNHGYDLAIPSRSYLIS